MQRRKLLRNGLVGITAVTLAGCSSSDSEPSTEEESDDSSDGTGDTSTDDEEETSTEDEEESSTEEETSTDDEDESSTEEEETQTEEDEENLPTVQLSRTPYEFSEGESYSYDRETHSATSEDTWEVTGLSGNGVTVEATRVQDGETSTVTKSTNSEDIYREIDLELGGFLYTNLRNVQPYVGVDELTPGNKFTLDTSSVSAIAWDSETVEVQGETTVNGISCIEFTATAEYDGSSVTKTACVADGYPFALSLVFKQDGLTLIDTTLTEINAA